MPVFAFLRFVLVVLAGEMVRGTLRRASRRKRVLDETHTGVSYTAVGCGFNGNESKYILNQVSLNKVVGESVGGNVA